MRTGTAVGVAGRGERAGQTGGSSREEVSRREQRALTLSMYGVALVTAGSIAYGLYLASDVVILSGIFSLLSLVGGGSTRNCCATTPRSGWWTSGSASKATRCWGIRGSLRRTMGILGMPRVSTDVLLSLIYPFDPAWRGLHHPPGVGMWTFPDDYSQRVGAAVYEAAPALRREGR